MTTPDKATEAGLGPVAHRPKAAAQHEADTVAVLAQDSKAARILARAEAARVKAEASEEAKDREAARAHRAEAASLEAEAHKAMRKQAKADNRAAQRAEGRRTVAGWATRAAAHVRSEAAASYAGFIYLVVVAVAFHSQSTTFDLLFAWHAPLNWLGAAFVEGVGVAFIATSIAQRLQGRSGWVARVLGWLVTGFAAFINYQAYEDRRFHDVPLMALALGASSVIALLLLEVRTAHQVAQKLEDADQKDKPQARLGLRFCVRYPGQAWWALSAMIAMPSVRTRTKALRAGRAMAHLRRKAKLNAYLMTEAERALHAAQKKAGTSEAVLARLTELAYLGLDGLDLQNQLASAAADIGGPQAGLAPVASEATAARPRPSKAAAQPVRPTPRPTAQPSAQPASKANGRRSEAEPSFEAWAEEAWADRPSGPTGWAQRVAELAEVFPERDSVPSRAKLIEAMKLRALDPELPPLRFAWTNKGYVGWAMADLDALRKKGYPDPQLSTDRSDINS